MAKQYDEIYMKSYALFCGQLEFSSYVTGWLNIDGNAKYPELRL
jgi:hypothetical protein